jgi:2-oxoisovalerate dehydrogenase E1 component alpha subunit
MESRGWWNQEAEIELKAKIRTDVMNCFKRADALKRCELGELFTDVYGGEEPWNIVCPTHQLSCEAINIELIVLRLQKEQKEELTQLLKKYGQVWEPWRSELSKFKNSGKDLLGSK